MSQPPEPQQPTLPTPRQPARPWTIVLGVLAVVVAGTGGIVVLTRGGDGRKQDYIDALAAVTEAQQAADLDFSVEENRCFAEAIVEVVGVDRLEEVATPDEMRTSRQEEALDAIRVDRRQAEAVYDDSRGCIDYRQIFLNAARQEAVPDAQLECLDRVLTEDLARNFVVASFAADGEAMADADQALADAAAPCAHAGSESSFD